MSEPEIEPCPSCGALPCDWVNDPHRKVEAVDWRSLRDIARHRTSATSGFASVDDDAWQELAAAIAALPRDEWRTMESAPRDGTDILLFHTTHGPIAGRFAPGEWSEDTPVSPREYSGAVWVLGDDIEQVEVEELPEGYHDGAVVAWMPLPTPPSIRERKE